MRDFLASLPGLIAWLWNRAPAIGGVLANPRTRALLPPLNAPVPVVSLATEEFPNAEDRANTALVLKPGQYLYVGLSDTPLIGGDAAIVHVVVHGGYYGKPGAPPA